MLGPLDADIIDLDRAIAAELRIIDLSWHQDRPVLAMAGCTVPVGPDTFRQLATTHAVMLSRPSLDLAA